MRCKGALDQLNARQDGQLTGGDVIELEAHLAACASCRMAADAMTAVDTELRRAFAARRQGAERVADSTIAALHAAGTSEAFAKLPIATVRPWAWSQILFGMAAGFLVAVGLLRPWQQVQVGTQPLALVTPMARMAVVTGPIEVQPASQIHSFTCPADEPLAQDSVVRTGPDARCEIAFENGRAVRLDCNTEITLRAPEIVEIKQGRLLTCKQPEGQPLEIRSAGATIVPKQNSQLAVECREESTRMLVVDGTAQVQTGAETAELQPGQALRLTQGRLEVDRVPADFLLETGWANSILALRGVDHAELDDRVNRLLAAIGAAKLSLLYEDELRRLGDDGVPPLLAYLTTTASTPNVAARTTAARIVADVAETRWIPNLIALLGDSNTNVRCQVARGLERLTGRDQGQSAEGWRTESWATCQSAHDRWLAWWQENRDRYPAARRDVPVPAIPPAE